MGLKLNGNEQDTTLSSYSAAPDAEKVLVLNGDSEVYSGETLLDLTNIATDTTAYGYFDMAGYRYFTLHGIASSGTTDVLTVTVEATCQDDGTAAASCTYFDVTNSLFGVDEWIDTSFMEITPSPVGFKYVRVKYNTSNNSGADCALTVYLRKFY